MDFLGIFDKCKQLALKKRADYTSTSDTHENFKRSGEIASWFKSDIDKPYAVLIGIKLARLGSLLSKGTDPNFESIEDNFIDLVNYMALWAERRTGGIKETRCHACHSLQCSGQCISAISKF